MSSRLIRFTVKINGLQLKLTPKLNFWIVVVSRDLFEARG